MILGQAVLVSQILDFLDYATKQLEKAENVGIIYLGFSKAFDKVPFNRLMCKLPAYGIERLVLSG